MHHFDCWSVFLAPAGHFAHFSYDTSRSEVCNKILGRRSPSRCHQSLSHQLLLLLLSLKPNHNPSLPEWPHHESVLSPTHRLKRKSFHHLRDNRTMDQFLYLNPLHTLDRGHAPHLFLFSGTRRSGCFFNGSCNYQFFGCYREHIVPRAPIHRSP